MSRTLSVQNHIDRITVELDQETNAKFAFWLTTYFDQADDATATERQYLRAKVDAIDFLLGSLWREIDTQDEAGTVKLSQQTAMLREIRKDTVGKLAAGSGGIVTVRPSRGTAAT